LNYNTNNEKFEIPQKSVT